MYAFQICREHRQLVGMLGTPRRTSPSFSWGIHRLIWVKLETGGLQSDSTGVLTAEEEWVYMAREGCLDEESETQELDVTMFTARAPTLRLLKVKLRLWRSWRYGGRETVLSRTLKIFLIILDLRPRQWESHKWIEYERNTRERKNMSKNNFIFYCWGWDYLTEIYQSRRSSKDLNGYSRNTEGEEAR